MSKASELLGRYEADLARLQAECPHAELHPWAAEYWAPAHATGRAVRVCVECHKVVESRDRA